RLGERLIEASVELDPRAAQHVREQELRLEPRRRDPRLGEALGRPVEHGEGRPGHGLRIAGPGDARLRRMRIASCLALLAACGDNASDCAPAPPPLPTGRLSDPSAPPLPDCVPGGLRDLPGRWFVAAAGAGFAFEYPKFEGSCEAGFRRTFQADDT